MINFLLWIGYWLRNWKAHARYLMLGNMAGGGLMLATATLRAVVIRTDGAPLPLGWNDMSEPERDAWRKAHERKRVDLGTISRRVITTVGVNYIRDAFTAHAGSADVQNMHFHDWGTGTTAEAIGDTDLVTPANPTTRATGTVDASVSAHFKTVATITAAGSVAITEHGIFNQASRSGVGVLLDRSVFAAVNLLVGESIQFTYDLSMPAGG